MITQQQLVVYNIPQHQAIDFIETNKYVFKSDSLLAIDTTLQKKLLYPSRSFFEVSAVDTLPALIKAGPGYIFGDKVILLVEGKLTGLEKGSLLKADLAIISQNPNISISDLLQTIDCKQIVIDASNAPWKAKQWQLECLQKQISCHYVVDKGSFVMRCP